MSPTPPRPRCCATVETFFERLINENGDALALRRRGHAGAAVAAHRDLPRSAPAASASMWRTHERNGNGGIAAGDRLHRRHARHGGRRQRDDPGGAGAFDDALRRRLRRHRRRHRRPARSATSSAVDGDDTRADRRAAPWTTAPDSRLGLRRRQPGQPDHRRGDRLAAVAGGDHQRARLRPVSARRQRPRHQAAARA